MDATVLSGLAGAVLSLVFSYLPGLSDKWEPLEPTQKRLIMGLLLVLVAGVAFGLGCANISSSVTCDQAGATGLLKLLGAALVANQSTYMISPAKPAKLP